VFFRAPCITVCGRIRRASVTTSIPEFRQRW